MEGATGRERIRSEKRGRGRGGRDREDGGAQEVHRRGRRGWRGRTESKITGVRGEEEEGGREWKGGREGREEGGEVPIPVGAQTKMELGEYLSFRAFTISFNTKDLPVPAAPVKKKDFPFLACCMRN
jgi:hypothetical protein